MRVCIVSVYTIHRYRIEWSNTPAACFLSSSSKKTPWYSALESQKLPREPFSAGFPSRSFHGQGNIEDSFAFEPARFNAIRHHLLEFAVEFGIRLRITFLFLARDEDLLIVGLAVAILFRSRTGCLCPLAHLKREVCFWRDTYFSFIA